MGVAFPWHLWEESDSERRDGFLVNCLWVFVLLPSFTFSSGKHRDQRSVCWSFYCHQNIKCFLIPWAAISSALTVWPYTPVVYKIYLPLKCVNWISSAVIFLFILWSVTISSQCQKPQSLAWMVIKLKGTQFGVWSWIYTIKNLFNSDSNLAFCLTIVKCSHH